MKLRVLKQSKFDVEIKLHDRQANHLIASLEQLGVTTEKIDQQHNWLHGFAGEFLHQLKQATREYTKRGRPTL